MVRQLLERWRLSTERTPPKVRLRLRVLPPAATPSEEASRLAAEERRAEDEEEPSRTRFSEELVGKPFSDSEADEVSVEELGETLAWSVLRPLLTARTRCFWPVSTN